MSRKRMTKPLEWRCRDRVIRFDRSACIMGILNVTPDSFSDGGTWIDPEKAVAHALEMIDEGADIIDIGGESTRPGAEAVDAEEEIKRVIPVVRTLRAQSDIPISVDTCKASVAQSALDAGADIINDISACTMDPAMQETARRTQAGLILMHMSGTPQTMQQAPHYQNVVAEVAAYLQNRLEFCRREGLDERRIALDPGIGFGKTPEHNVQLLAGIPELISLGRPLLIGISRKSVLGHITGRTVSERLAAGLAAAVCALERGAHILRVHDVKETCDAAKVVSTIRSVHLSEANVTRT